MILPKRDINWRVVQSLRSKIKEITAISLTLLSTSFSQKKQRILPVYNNHMKAIKKQIRFYPFSFQPHSDGNKYEIIKYNLVTRTWDVITDFKGTEECLENLVRDLNEGVGPVCETFIVEYTN